MGDSTAAFGWLHKSLKLASNKHPQLTLAKTILQRQLADLIIDNKNLLHSQLFLGSTNVIPDLLSRDWHLDYSEMINFLTHIFTTQLHPYFWLSQVPSVLDSFSS